MNIKFNFSYILSLFYLVILQSHFQYHSARFDIDLSIGAVFIHFTFSNIFKFGRLFIYVQFLSLIFRCLYFSYFPLINLFYFYTILPAMLAFLQLARYLLLSFI